MACEDPNGECCGHDDERGQGVAVHDVEQCVPDKRTTDDPKPGPEQCRETTSGCELRVRTRGAAGRSGDEGADTRNQAGHDHDPEPAGNIISCLIPAVPAPPLDQPGVAEAGSKTTSDREPHMVSEKGTQCGDEYPGGEQFSAV